MERVPIAELRPELAAPESKHFRAVAMLIWPYSSSQRQFALLLAEPDIRLRRKNGQVRVRFAGSSARAVATTGVGIGDEVVLGLRGAQFVREGTVSTPGKSIDIELSYSQTLSIQVLRNGSEVANIELADATPTPTPMSPIRDHTRLQSTPTGTQQWASPAFLKRARLSNGPIFNPPLERMADDGDEDGHDRKRRRKSYRDWKAWTYLKRTPSPEKRDDDIRSSSGGLEASPIRVIQLPKTPISPQIDHDKGVDKDFVRDTDYYDLYAGPNEAPPPDMQHAYGGDTEEDTEEDQASELLNAEEASLPESISNESGNGQSVSQDVLDVGSPSSHSILVPVNKVSDSKDVADSSSSSESGIQNTEQAAILVDEHSEVPQELASAPNLPQIVMPPPPTLPSLQTEFSHSLVPGVPTPIGAEPSSPTLKPLDSSTLPLPSPFPGERDETVTSYLDFPNAGQQSTDAAFVAAEAQNPSSEASYILESSFYSSVSASHAPAYHPTHESAFTDLRFTFGMDISNQTQLQGSSPSPQVQAPMVSNVSDNDMQRLETSQGKPTGQEVEVPNERFSTSTRNRAQSRVGIDESINLEHSLTTVGHKGILEDRSSPEAAIAQYPTQASSIQENEPVVVSPTSESEPEDDQDEDGSADVEQITDVNSNVEQEIESDNELVGGESETQMDSSIIGFEQLDGTGPSHPPKGTQQSAVATDIIDLGSPSEDSDQDLADFHIIKEENEKQTEKGEMDKDGPLGSSAQDVRDESNDIPVLEENHNEAAADDQVQETFGIDSDPNFDFSSYTVFPNASETKIETHMDGLPLYKEHDSQSMANSPHVATEKDDYPDVKMESIEDVQSFQQIPHKTAPIVNEDHDALPAQPTELLIKVPEEGHKLGEMHERTVPATGPARNTRSKTKISASPVKDETPPQRTTRSGKSRATSTPKRATLSPFGANTSPTPPYSLRSHSKLFSPSKASDAGSPRKRTSKQSANVPMNSANEQVLSPPFRPTFAGSQELGGSQGKFSNMPFVQDSEEGSLHSEHSISTEYFSDAWNDMGLSTYPFTGSDSTSQALDSGPALLKHPPAGRQRTPDILNAKTQWRDKPQVVISPKNKTPSKPTGSHITQSQPNSPSKYVQSMASPKVHTSGSRRSRRLNNVIDLPSVSSNETSEGGHTPKASNASHLSTYQKSEGGEIRSSPPLSVRSEEHLPGSLEVLQPESLKSIHQSHIQNNLPVTPEASQQTSNSQPPFNLIQQEQSMPLTPQPTQSSAEYPSFKSHLSLDGQKEERLGKELSVSVSAPRRNVTTEDVASREASPSVHSEDMVASDEDTLVPELTPSIGLSTPLAYYTPLKDLCFFLNRSSQFHSSSNPDVLALVTSGTTPPKKADKGPKHWNTTMHITDLSLYPSTTTVQIFRPYESALPVAEKGDVVLFRSFQVKSLNRHPMLLSGEESAWAVWRYTKPIWGMKRGVFGEVRVREEIKGPAVERGAGEWREAEKVRAWYSRVVKRELEEKEEGQRVTRSRDNKGTMVTESAEA